MWINVDKTRPNSAHYSIMALENPVDGGMDALRGMFPDGKADELNAVLFSTSGVHGTYNTIEEAEDFLNGRDLDGIPGVTFVVVHPRLVALRYGVCNPQSQNDIDFLKQLRASSHAELAKIGV